MSEQRTSNLHGLDATTLEARDIAFAYPGGGQVLEQVSAQILPGSFLAILGVNGSGKSTLLSCLDDIIRPQRGEVLLAGCALSDLTREERARQIALVAQHSHAHGVTVYDALLLGRKPYIKSAPTEEDYAVVDRVIDELGLGPLALRYLDELSGGEHQKVVIGRAFVQETNVLLLDEPTNNLDMANQVEVMSLARKAAHERDIACAAVMHDINLALRFCDRFLMLKDGKVCACGTRDIITKELLQEVYGTPVDLVEYDGSFLVVPLRRNEPTEKDDS